MTGPRERILLDSIGAGAAETTPEAGSSSRQAVEQERRQPTERAATDTPSGFQLAWRPTPDMAADSTQSALASLFAEHGTPLVLKCDNGAAFSAPCLRRFLASCQVSPLYSPHYWSRYNGACEAGIGQLKRRTAWQAAGTTLHAAWTAQHVRTALAITNDLIRSWERHQRTRRQLWQARVWLDAHVRSTVARPLDEARLAACTHLGCPPGQLLDRSTQARVDRIAIPRALRRQGLLHVTARLITPPLAQLKTAKIW
jgi:hypothetical protein